MEGTTKWLTKRYHVKHKRDVVNTRKNSNRDDSSERHRKDSRISKYETQSSSSSFKNDQNQNNI